SEDPVILGDGLVVGDLVAVLLDLLPDLRVDAGEAVRGRRSVAEPRAERVRRHRQGGLRQVQRLREADREVTRAVREDDPLAEHLAGGHAALRDQIGRASCRERECDCEWDAYAMTEK